jgi:predicted  nucleic acid-binding Zn-ribbon protein
MSTTMETLYELQGRLLQKKAATATREAGIRELREKVPPPILAHFDRLIAQGRKGVALVRGGVCGACHLRVSAATAASLVRPDDIFLCENCGCYLMLSPEESLAAERPAAPAKAPGRPARKKPVVTAA